MLYVKSLPVRAVSNFTLSRSMMAPDWAPTFSLTFLARAGLGDFSAGPKRRTNRATKPRTRVVPMPRLFLTINALIKSRLLHFRQWFWNGAS